MGSVLRQVSGGLMLGVLALAGTATPFPAYAAQTSAYARWGAFTGTANDYATTMQIPVTGFPEAAVTSDSRAGGVGIISGATSWLGANTPFGEVYGSSRDQPYLSLRPKVDNASGASMTTYTFADPTPPSGWAVAFADIDADQVRVSATDANGDEVSAADLGAQPSFNFCDTRPRPSQCSASIGDTPTWDPATQILVGNPQARDTVGAVGWFEPTVSLSSLRVEFTRRAGFPTYSTSFAAVARTLSGRVHDVSTGAASCPVGSVSVRLTGPDGESLGERTPGSDGSYTFGQVATQPGYTVSADAPPGCAGVGPDDRMVSTVGADATADFDVRAVLPQAVSGTVTAGADPLPDVRVTLHGPGGRTVTTTTAADGGYLFDDNPTGAGYYVSIEEPPGYDGPDRRAPFEIDTAAITGQDFVLTASPDVSGTVSGGGGGLGGVTLTLTPADGPAVETVTGADGSYTFERVPRGTYDIVVTPPTGFDRATPITGIDVAGADVTGQDFALTRPGALGGRVTKDSTGGDPVNGALVGIDGPGGPRALRTDGAGDYFLDDLAAGTYTITLTVPDRYIATGPTTRTVTITAAGEIRGGQDFTVRGVSTGPTSTPTAPTTGAPVSASGSVPGSRTSGSGGGSHQSLPDTGGVSLLVVYAALALLGGGAALLVAARRRPRG